MTIATTGPPVRVHGIVEVSLVSLRAGALRGDSPAPGMPRPLPSRRSAPAPSHPPVPRETSAKPTPVPSPAVSPPQASAGPEGGIALPEPSPAARTEAPNRAPFGTGTATAEDGSWEGGFSRGEEQGSPGQADGIDGGEDGGRSGGGSAAVLRARIQEKILYPEEAVRRGQEGEVLLRIRIDPGGVPREIRVARSSGVRILDEAARRGVVRAAPLPSEPGWIEVPVRFSLR
ncbi:MAG: hypothetical protein Kow00128_21640 [Deltaproteobacteria bacterium]